jgi:hypothetical protein
MAFLILLSIPLVIAVAGFILLDGITWKEFLVQVGGQLLIAGVSTFIIYSSNTHDTEIWNGLVTGKARDWVSCSHSYRCHCHDVQSCSGSGKNRSCSTHEECDTCYEHPNDWNWNVSNSIGETFTIERVDRRGSFEPPRFTAVKMGEPTSSTHWYTNYIKAAPGTLFRHQGLKGKFLKYIPPYPDRVYDYYRLNRLVLVNGARVDDAEAWNADLALLNGKLGHRKQSNIIVVLARDLPDDFFYALEEAWVGARKNDTVLVIDTDGQLKPQWAVVMAWTSQELFKIKLRDDIMDLPAVTREATIAALDKDVGQFYKRKPMAEFEYLKASITPTTTQLVVSLIFGLMVAFGLAYLFQKQDVFGDE